MKLGKGFETVHKYWYVSACNFSVGFCFFSIVYKLMADFVIQNLSSGYIVNRF